MHHKQNTIPRPWFFLTLLIAGLTFACSSKTTDTVLVTTPRGDFSIRLYDETKEYQKNFLTLTREGFYDSLLFHRVIPDVIIQGGDPESKKAAAGRYLGQGGPDYTLNPDFRYVHTYGAVAAARKPDEVNPKKKSSGSQFYVVIGHPVTDTDLDKIEKEKGFSYTEEQRKLYKLLGGLPELDKDYSVFGEVTSGMEIVRQISRVPRDVNNRPTEDIQMQIKPGKKNAEK